MSNFAIQVDNVSKLYHIGKRQKYKTARESIMNMVSAPVRMARKMFGPPAPADNATDLWALKDVSFKVNHGDVVGIVGRNGAGKSTLLKVLSRITEPTSGRIKLNGRVGSLLEVGTGFHPELTGRENIFLNGAILGMRRPEIIRKFDEIVAFSEVDRFIDTPVKHYSSGMYMRLAFAVAAHLEPEILIVDEVLAVGDAAFQKKCLGKMSDVAKQGRTVLFVSHNMGSIAALCSVGVMMVAGRVDYVGAVSGAMERYFGNQEAGHATYVRSSVPPTPHFARIEARQGELATSTFSIDEPLNIHFEVDTGKSPDPDLVVGIVITNSQGVWVHHSSDEFSDDRSIANANKRVCVLPPYALGVGRYQVDAYLGKRNYEKYQKAEGCISFQIEFTGRMSDRTSGSDWKGMCGPGLPAWQVES